MAPYVDKSFKKYLKEEIKNWAFYNDYWAKDYDVSQIRYGMQNTDVYNMVLEILKKSEYDKACLADAEKIYNIASYKTEEETHQAMEAVVFNFNSLHSRAGGQVPFSSINFGTDTSPEGRLVIKEILKATEAGLGNGETAIFPISVFKVKSGINYEKNDPNYDLFRYACRVSAKRLFPNFINLNAPYNAKYIKK